MFDNNSERSGSSQGRGRNTQSEPHLHEKIDLTLMMRETSQRRRGFHSRNEPKDLEVTAELLAIDRALEEALRGYSKILTETNLVQIIKEYLSNDKSAGIRYDIRSLQRILLKNRTIIYVRRFSRIRGLMHMNMQKWGIC